MKHIISLILTVALLTSCDSESAPAASKPAITVSADTLFRAYDANEVSADSKYKGNIVIVDGTIHNISKDIMGSPYVIIGGKGFLDGVQCVFSRTDTSAGALSKGQHVTIRGKVDGKIGNVLVSGASLQ